MLGRGNKDSMNQATVTAGGCGEQRIPRRSGKLGSLRCIRWGTIRGMARFAGRLRSTWRPSQEGSAQILEYPTAGALKALAAGPALGAPRQDSPGFDLNELPILGDLVVPVIFLVVGPD
jgi:hypothetical protein